MLNKDDQAFIKQYVACFKLISQSTGEILGGVLGLDGELLYQSEFSKRLGISQEDVIEHLHRSDILLLQQKAIEKRVLVKYLYMGVSAEGRSMFLILSYAPIINAETKNVVALYSNSQVFDTPSIWLILSKYYNEGIAVIDEFKYQIKLTSREKQVVFLFLLNLDSNTIADVISKIEGKKISKNAIDQVFKSQLIPKFAVYGRKALYERLIDLGYYRFIPNNVLRNGFCIEITDYMVFDF